MATTTCCNYGRLIQAQPARLAQFGLERSVHIREVVGSNPSTGTEWKISMKRRIDSVDKAYMDSLPFRVMHKRKAEYIAGLIDDWYQKGIRGEYFNLRYRELYHEKYEVPTQNAIREQAKSPKKTK